LVTKSATEAHGAAITTLFAERIRHIGPTAARKAGARAL
jgi:hypothetical protein